MTRNQVVPSRHKYFVALVRYVVILLVGNARPWQFLSRNPDVTESPERNMDMFREMIDEPEGSLIRVLRSPTKNCTMSDEELLKIVTPGLLPIYQGADVCH